MFDLFLSHFPSPSEVDSPIHPREAIACVHRTEPYIIEVMNSTRVPQAVRAVGKGGDVSKVDLANARGRVVRKMDPELGSSVIPSLSSAEKLVDYHLRFADSTFSWTAVSFICVSAHGFNR